MSLNISMEVEPSENVVVGTELTVKLKRDGQPFALTEHLASRIDILPKGVIEATGNGRYLVVGAGTASLALTEGNVDAVVSVTAECAAVSAAPIQHAGQISDEEWTAEEGIHRVEGIVRVNGKLIIGPCAKLEMGPGAALIVGEQPGAQLIIRGTRENPVVMEGVSRDDGARAHWQGIRVHVNNADGSMLRWVTLRNADGFAYGNEERAVIDLVGSHRVYDCVPIVFEGVVVEGCADVGIRLRDIWATVNIEWRNNRVVGCGGYPISIDAGSLGAIPTGTYEGNAPDEVRCVGGWAGPNYQIWRNVGIPYHVEQSIVIAPDFEGIASHVPNARALGRIYKVVEAGSVFRFEKATGIFVGQDPMQGISHDPMLHKTRFSVHGTIQHPVRFTSTNACHSLSEDTCGAAPGDWVGIVLMPNVHTRLSQNSYGEGFIYVHEAGNVKDYMTQFRNMVLEYAGGQSGFKNPDGSDRVGGVIVLVQSDYDGKLPWLVEGSLLRRNRGYGLVSAVTEITAGNLLDGARLAGLRTCSCDNELGPVSLPDDKVGTAATPEPGTACPCAAQAGGGGTFGDNNNEQADDWPSLEE
ncbi:hypothetical protein ACFL6C_11535 [Myxococcota bacterium]